MSAARDATASRRSAGPTGVEQVKTYPHPTEAEDFQEAQSDRAARYAEMSADLKRALDERNERYMELLAEDALDLAALSYAFDGAKADTLRRLRDMCRHAAKAVEFELPLEPSLFMLYLSAAIVANDKPLRELLSETKRERFTDPEVDAPEAAYLSAEIQADLTAGRTDKAAERVGKATAALAGANRFARAEFGPLIQLAKSILEKDQKAFDEALAARHKYYARFYSDPDYQGFPEGLLDVRGLAMMKLARGVGLTPEFESVYLPAGLLEG